MPRYKVVLEAQAPLLLGDSLPTGNVQRSRPFVAGSVLRGVLAKAILFPLGLWRHSGHPSQDASLPEPFSRVFLQEPRARFGFLYPVRENSTLAHDRDAFPIPLTAHTCKAHKGFKTDDGGHGVFDWLLGMLRRKAGGEPGWPTKCPQEGCGERLDRMRGYGIREGTDNANMYHEGKAHPRTFVRVGLNRLTETAEERILYSLEALVPGPGGEDREQPLSFVGYWTMSEIQWGALRQLLGEHLVQENGAYPLRIGTARARGMGLVNLHLSQAPSLFSPLEKRLESFQPKGTNGQPLDADHLYFAITLRAPLLLYDAQGLPTTRVSPKTLRAYVTMVPLELRLLSGASMVEQETWSGWSAAWGLPKPVTPAIAAGSVLAFRAPAGEGEAVLAFLQDVEENGLGERRAEGWGEVVACDPFHVIFDAGGTQ